MKIQLRYLFIFISFIIGSCAGDKYYLTIEDIDNTASDDSNSNPTKYYTLSFNASVLSSSSNKYSEESKTPYNSDTVLFSTGRVIHFFVYKGVNSSPYSNQYYFMGIYYAYENGFIKPQYSQYEILLPVGIYSIYAISEYNNPSDKTPPFSNSNGLGGEMVDLVNTLNYLWWKTTNIVVDSSSNNNINIYFSQISTEIQLNFSAAQGSSSFNLVDYNIQGPNTENSILQLATGVISQTTDSLTSMFDLTQYNDTTLYVNMVPFRPNQSTIRAEICINVSGSDNWYKAYLPVPSGGFIGGNCYIYNVVVNIPTSSLNTNLKEIRTIDPDRYSQ